MNRPSIRSGYKTMEPKPTYKHTYQQLYGQPPPQTVTFTDSNADIISNGRGFIGGFDLTMQLQVGCPGGCLFCYVPTGGRLAPAAVRQNWGFEVRNKRNVLRKFRAHLEKGTLADKTVYWSGVTDPYAAPPEITQNLWRILCDAPPTLRPRRIAVQTRFRPARDAPLIARYCQTTRPKDQGPPVVVSFSIGTDQNALIRAWERATPRFEARMRAIETLRGAGIVVVPTLSPFGLWNDLPATLQQFKAWGIPYITVLFFKEDTRWANTPPRFLELLHETYPMLLNPQWQAERVREMKTIYGRKRVLVGQAGFASLATPHYIARARSYP
jgi:DNA repair photolyase